MSKSSLYVRSVALFSCLWAVASAACASASSPSSSSGSGGASASTCMTDNDCKGSRVCVSGACIDPVGTSPGGKGGSGPSTGAGGTGVGPGAGGMGTAGTGTAFGMGGTGNSTPPCAAVSSACSSTGATCCQTGQGIGSEGALCIADDGVCHAACSTNSECNSGCCAAVTGQTFGVCATASHCGGGGTGGCSDPGSSCTKSGDCCQTGSKVGPNGATCLSDDSVCHAKCYSNSECGSGCCVPLSGVSYGACGSPSKYTCM